MAHTGPASRTLTLKTCLEAIARFGEDYILSAAGDEWTASALLHWLQTNQPQVLRLPVYLVPPDANGEGAIYEMDAHGQVITDVPFYHIERQRPIIPSAEGAPEHLNSQ